MAKNGWNFVFFYLCPNFSSFCVCLFGPKKEQRNPKVFFVHGEEEKKRRRGGTRGEGSVCVCVSVTLLFACVESQWCFFLWYEKIVGIIYFLIS